MAPLGLSAAAAALVLLVAAATAQPDFPLPSDFPAPSDGADPFDPAAPVVCPGGIGTVDVDPERYFTGLWFQSAVSESAGRFAVGENKCVTANYTFNQPADDKPASVRVYNCDSLTQADNSLSCLEGRATQPDTTDNGKFLVSFFPPNVGNYWIVDIYGKPEDGYTAAAVYSCEVIPGVPFPVFNLFIISRFRALRAGGEKGAAALRKVIYPRLLEKGIDVSTLGMIETPRQKISECNYFFGSPVKICRG